MRRRTLIVLAGIVLMPAWVDVAMPSTSGEYLAVMKASPDPERGARYFASCAHCHGAKGGGSTDGRIPRIGGQHFRVIVRQLVAYRHGERSDVLMENSADRNRIADAQAIADVAGYISQLDDPTPPGIGTGDLVAHGGSIYFRLCETCHGTSGQGDASQGIPRIAGQHYEYLRRQMSDAGNGRRRNFPLSHVRLLAQLDHDDIAGVADYLSRIAPH